MGTHHLHFQVAQMMPIKTDSLQQQYPLLQLNKDFQNCSILSWLHYLRVNTSMVYDKHWFVQMRQENRMKLRFI